MENLEIINTQITVQAKKIINGNTASFSWNYSEGSLPQAVNFNVQRGVTGDETFTGNNIISGAYYPESGKYDFQNNSLIDGDVSLYEDVLMICKGIVTGLE